MQFVGLGSFYSDRNSLSLATSPVSDIAVVELSNAKFDCLYFSTDMDLEQYETGMPDEWQKETNDEYIIDVTLLMADFRNTCNASSVGFDTKNVNKIIIKKRKNTAGEPWYNFFVKNITCADDFKFSFHDRYCACKTPYQYSIIPVCGDVEMDLNIIFDVYSDFEGYYIADINDYYGSNLCVSRTMTRNTASNTVTTLSSKYPYVCRNGASNYTSGNISAIFIEYKDGSFDLDGCFEYRNSFYDFLTNGNPKLLKFNTGELKLIQIGDSISEDSSIVSYAPTTSFDFVEIGDASDHNDLSKYGLLHI